MRVTIETTVNVPLERAWTAWVTPSEITQWNFASDAWCCPKAEVDLVPGGKFRSRMEAKDGSMGFDFEGTFISIPTVATITALNLQDPSGGASYRPTIEYEVGDHRYSYTPRASVYPCPGHIGDVIAARYDERDPSVAALDSFTSLWLFPTLMFLFGLLMLIGAGCLWLIPRHDRTGSQLDLPHLQFRPDHATS